MCPDRRSDAGRLCPFALLIGAVLCGGACGNRETTTPIVPTSPGGSTPTPNMSPTHVAGWARDSAFQPLPGARIEIVDGAQAGASVVTGGDGRFEFTGTLTGSVTMRATKDEFAGETHAFTWGPATQFQGYGFDLEPLGPSLMLEPGEYMVTITGDRTAAYGGASCDRFPADLLTRRYQATVMPFAAHPHTQFSVTLQLNNPAPIASSLGFGIGIAGNIVGFTIDGPAIVEVLPNYTYLEIAGSAPSDASATATGGGLVVPFSGSFEYCALPAPMSTRNNCFTAPEKLEYAQCLSMKDQMVFTRR